MQEFKSKLYKSLEDPQIDLTNVSYGYHLEFNIKKSKVMTSA